MAKRKKKKRSPLTLLCVIIALFFLMYLGYRMASGIGVVIALFGGFIVSLAIWELVQKLKH